MPVAEIADKCRHSKNAGYDCTVVAKIPVDEGQDESYNGKWALVEALQLRYMGARTTRTGED
jgi:hypothetical protein